MRRERKLSQRSLQAVSEVSSIGRGRHTTRAISFLQLPSGGFLADTPGFNLPDLSGISSQSLQMLFPEIRRLTNGSDSENRCRFANCQHLLEPDCVVNGHDWERYPVYCRLHGEIQERETYEKQVLQLSKKQREGLVKKKTAKGGKLREEALLEAKRHRRVSRRTMSQDLQEMVHLAEDEDE